MRLIRPRNRFFAEGTKGDYIFLIDEAHNLVERGRDMFSATLVKEEILKVRQLLRPYAPGKKLEKALNRCNHQMLVYKRECDSCTELESVSTFLMMVNQLLEELAGKIKDGSMCGLGQTAPNPVLTTLKYFRNELAKFFRDLQFSG